MMATKMSSLVGGLPLTLLDFLQSLWGLKTPYSFFIDDDWDEEEMDEETEEIENNS
jgi:hypothetical protein